MHCHFSSLKKVRNIGFTLVELLVITSIASILLIISIPSFQGLLIKNNIRRIADDFVQSVFKARNVAVSKNVCTMMCMSSSVTSSAPSCDVKNGNDWQAGWMVFINSECDSSKNSPSAPEDILEVRVGIGAEYFLKTQSSVSKILFNSRGINGLSGAAEFDIQYRDISDENNDKYGVNICVDALGRTRLIPFSKQCKNYS